MLLTSRRHEHRSSNSNAIPTQQRIELLEELLLLFTANLVRSLHHLMERQPVEGRVAIAAVWRLDDDHIPR